MPEFSRWKKVAAIELGFETYHPQGIVKKDGVFFLSTVDRASAKGYLIAFTLSDGPLAGAVAHEVRRITLVDGDHGERYHPGGMDVDDASGQIWVPVAEYRAKSSAAFYVVDPRDLSAQRVAELPDHIGGVIVDRVRAVYRGFDWDIGVYSFPAAPGGAFPSAGGPWQPFIHPIDEEYGAFEYQDCKHVTGGDAVCSGVVGLHGVVDLIRFDDGASTAAGSIPYHVIHRVNVPVVGRSGDPDTAAPGDPPLSNNPVTFESTAAGLRLYFVPHDGPGSRLLVYDVPAG
jgi:hypothetical protein